MSIRKYRTEIKKQKDELGELTAPSWLIERIKKRQAAIAQSVESVEGIVK